MWKKIFLFLCSVHFLMIYSISSFSQQKNNYAISNEQQYFDSLFASDQNSFQRKFEFPFLLLLNEDQKKIYLEIESRSERKSFIASYWKKNNPDPILSENDWLLDFVGRCNYVNENFSSSEPPFFDDRGKYYLRYGKPSNRYRDSGGRKTVHFFTNKVVYEYIGQLYSGFRPSQYYWVYPNESWVYRNIAQDFIIHFVNESTAFREVNSLTKALTTGIGKNVAWYWNDMIQARAYLTPTLTRVANDLLHYEHELSFAAHTGRSPASRSSLLPHKRISNQKRLFEAEVFRHRRNPPSIIYYPINAVNTLNFISDISQFHDHGDSTRIEIVYLTPVQNNIVHEKFNSNFDTIEIELQSLFRDSTFQVQSATDDTLKYPLAFFHQVKFENLVNNHTMLLPGQNGDLTLQIKELTSEKIGYTKQPFTVRDFTGRHLMISDIQLFTEVSEEIESDFLPIIEKQKIQITPYPHQAIHKSIPVFCYFEIYNIQKAGIEEEFEIELTVFSNKEKVGIFKKFFKWIMGSKDAFISIVQNRSLTEDTSNELISTDFSNLSEGKYILEITVSDINNKGIKATAQRTITISE